MSVLCEFESLESRRLLSGDVGGLPSLNGTLTIKKMVVAVPDQRLTASLKITNGGGTLSKTSVAIGIYVSNDSSLDEAEKFDTISVKLSLKTGKSRTTALKFQLPEDTPEGTFYVLANINDDGAINEDTNADNLAASNRLINPVGQELNGTYTFNGDEEDLSLTFGSSDGKLLADVDAGGQQFSLQALNLTTSLSANGHFSAHGNGSDENDGVSKYSMSLKGILNLDTDTISGSFSASGIKEDVGHFRGRGTFNLSGG